MKAPIKTEAEARTFSDQLFTAATKAIKDGKTYDMKGETTPQRRSLDLNAYYHVVLSLYAIEIGNTLAEMKQDMKEACPFMHYEKNGKVYLVETKTSTNKLLSEHVEWIRNHAIIENGIRIPDAEEYRLGKYYFDNMIESCKKYL
jgi:hypothetical protein